MVRYRIDRVAIATGVKPTTPVPGSAIGPPAGPAPTGSGLQPPAHRAQPPSSGRRVIGATWLDQQLIGGGKGRSDLGIGGEVKHALRQRADFLAERGLAEQRG